VPATAGRELLQLERNCCWQCSKPYGHTSHKEALLHFVVGRRVQVRVRSLGEQDSSSSSPLSQLTCITQRFRSLIGPLCSFQR